jgi:hypothetical protein
VTAGRLVDGEGNGIPNQTIVCKSVAHVLGLTRVNPVESATRTAPCVHKSTLADISIGRSIFYQDGRCRRMIEYAGNDLYEPTSTSHGHVTVPHAAASQSSKDPPHSDLPFSSSCIDADPSALDATRFCIISQLVSYERIRRSAQWFLFFGCA